MYDDLGDRGIHLRLRLSNLVIYGGAIRRRRHQLLRGGRTNLRNASVIFFSSAVPSGSRVFQMPTCPSSSSASSSFAQLLRGGGRANLRNTSVIFLSFLA